MDRTERDADEDSLNLKQVALTLDVHYMTAYRYVRQGRLPAFRSGTEWRVPLDALDSFERSREIAAAPSPESRPETGAGTTSGSGAGSRSGSGFESESIAWADRMVPALQAGDEPMAWRLIEDVLAAGHDLAFCYLDVLAPAMAKVNIQASAGRTTAAQPALATIVTQRLTARLGPRFRRPGRTRGTIVIGAPEGEHHLLPLSMLADLLRVRGFGVLELGTDVPADAFVDTVRHADRLLAVGLGITTADYLEAARLTVSAIRTAAPRVPIIVGGQAILNPDIAEMLDADGWAPDGRTAVRTIVDLVDRADRQRSQTPPSVPSSPSAPTPGER